MEKNTEQNLAVVRERMMRLRQVREQLAEEVRLLMTHTEEEQLRWTGSVTDLMEALYCAFEQEVVTDEDGIPASFREIVRQCCRLLHVKMPSNPYETATRGRQRKGVKNSNYLIRYQRMLEKGTHNIFFLHIA